MAAIDSNRHRASKHKQRLSATRGLCCQIAVLTQETTGIVQTSVVVDMNMSRFQLDTLSFIDKTQASPCESRSFTFHSALELVVESWE